MNAYYNNKIHTNPEFYEKEKRGLPNMLRFLLKNRYNTDEEFKEKRKEYCRIKMKELYQRRKQKNKNKELFLKVI